MVGKITSGIVKWNSRGVWVKEEKKSIRIRIPNEKLVLFQLLCGDHIVETHP